MKWKVTERSSHGLIWSTILAFACRDWGKQWKAFVKILYKVWVVYWIYLTVILFTSDNYTSLHNHLRSIMSFLLGSSVAMLSQTHCKVAGSLITDSPISVLSLKSPPGISLVFSVLPCYRPTGKRCFPTVEYWLWWACVLIWHCLVMVGTVILLWFQDS
jgi:hypothetical protein